MASAATMATRVRVNCDCDDIFNLPFSGPLAVVPRAVAAESLAAVAWSNRTLSGDFGIDPLPGGIAG